MVLILRNGGSQSPDRWIKGSRNNHIESIADNLYTNNGINVDIFPLDNVINPNKTLFKIKRMMINYLKHCLKIKNCPSVFKDRDGLIKYCIDRCLVLEYK